MDRRELFVAALRDVDPAFDLFFKATNAAAGSDARRLFYELLPLRGERSRCAVIRRFLVLLADAEDASDDARHFAQLADDELIQEAAALGIIV